MTTEVETVVRPEDGPLRFVFVAVSDEYVLLLLLQVRSSSCTTRYFIIAGILIVVIVFAAVQKSLFSR